MRNTKVSSAGVSSDAFRMIKICVMGLSMASVPLFMKPVYGFLSVAIPRVRETFSAWLTPAFLYVILNCIIIAIVANSGVNIFSSSSHHEESCSPSPQEQEKEEKHEPKPKPEPIVREYKEESFIEEKKSETTSMIQNMATSEAFSAAETLEDTWKSIEARRPPPGRCLRKSDTLQTQRHRPQPPALESASLMSVSKFGKSETWNSGRNLDRQIVGAEMLKKEPSLGQDELNKRVEAFIAKVNHDIKLQREESLLDYKEMVNRGSG